MSSTDALPEDFLDLLDLLLEHQVDYAEAEAGAVTRELAGLELRFLGLDELVRNKRASGRTRDLLDVEMLVEAGVAKPEPDPRAS